MRALTPIALVVSLLVWLVACSDPPCPTGSLPTPEGRCAPGDDPMWLPMAGDGGVTAPDAGSTTAPGEPAPNCFAESSFDLPDVARRDANCDGIDGDLAASVFVATSGDDANDGLTRESPVRTITRGIEVAVAAGRSAVLVASGTYAEKVELVEGVGVHGGYDAPAWSRDGAATIVRADGVAVSADGIVIETIVSELTVRSEDAAPGESSIAVRIVRSTGVVLESVQVIAGRGGDGSAGDAATRRSFGGIYGLPGEASRQSGISSCTIDGVRPPQGGRGGPTSGACTCGQGGAGGMGGPYYYTGAGETRPDRGLPASRGLCPASPYGSGGEAGQDSTSPALRQGQTGARGADGADGSDGRGGSPVGAFTMDGYASAFGSSGDDGRAGTGGTGGGGGFGCTTASFCLASGGAGGGGGSGACGGQGGFGAEGGGASIGIFAWESSLVLRRTSIAVSGGGDGGAGGEGMAGGVGGAGGAGGASISVNGCVTGAGGRGGAGGNGGAGGMGGGGGGGPSVGVVLGGGAALDARSTEVSYDIGPGGAGGSSATPSSSGAAGMTAETYTP